MNFKLIAFLIGLFLVVTLGLAISSQACVLKQYDQVFVAEKGILYTVTTFECEDLFEVEISDDTQKILTITQIPEIHVNRVVSLIKAGLKDFRHDARTGITAKFVSISDVTGSP
jgi:hypothetical protein